MEGFKQSSGRNQIPLRKNSSGASRNSGLEGNKPGGSDTSSEP